MSKKHYKSVSDLKEVDQIFALAKKSLGSSTPVLKATSSGIPPVLSKAMLGATGVGATLAAGSVATTGVATAGLAVGGIGVAGVGAGALLAPVALPAVAITAVVYLLFKGKKERELRGMLQYRLKEAVKIQNQVIEQLDTYIHKLKNTLVSEIEKNNHLSRKVDELYAINQSLIGEINKMESQLS